MQSSRLAETHGKGRADGATVSGPDNPTDGVPEILLDPAITDDDTDPGDAASVVSHEMGHVKDPGARDVDKDKKADEEGQKKHFAIYKDELKELCDWLTYVKTKEPPSPWLLKRCETCKKYNEARAKANKLKHDGEDIGACAGCTGCQ